MTQFNHWYTEQHLRSIKCKCGKLYINHDIARDSINSNLFYAWH